MPEALVDAAPWIALASATCALAVVAVTARLAWQRWRVTRDTQQAALALIDVHQARLEDAIELANDHVGGLADDGERLASALSELRADARHLRWMVARVPTERDRLQRELVDLVLPTRRAKTDA